MISLHAPKPETANATTQMRCDRCERPLWEAAQREEALCSNCSLEADLFEPARRWV